MVNENQSEVELEIEQPTDEVEINNTSESHEDDKTNVDEDSNDNASTNPKSNFKKLHKRKKELEKLLSEKDKEIESLKKQSKKPEQTELEDGYSYQEEVDDLTEMKLDLFTTKNADAEGHTDEILEAMNTYKGISMKEAWDLVKSKMPETSKTKEDFNVNSQPLRVKKRVEDITEEEALGLSGAAYDKWYDYHIAKKK